MQIRADFPTTQTALTNAKKALSPQHVYSVGLNLPAAYHTALWVCREPGPTCEWGYLLPLSCANQASQKTSSEKRHMHVSEKSRARKDSSESAEYELSARAHKSPHCSLYMFCSPQPGRGLNRLLTRVKTEPHLPCVTRLLNTHGWCIPASSTFTMLLIFSANPGTSTSAAPAALNVTRRTVPVTTSCSSSSCISWKRLWSISTVCKEWGRQHRTGSGCWAGKGRRDAQLFAAVKTQQKHR